MESINIFPPWNLCWKWTPHANEIFSNILRWTIFCVWFLNCIKKLLLRVWCFIYLIINKIFVWLSAGRAKYKKKPVLTHYVIWHLILLKWDISVFISHAFLSFSRNISHSVLWKNVNNMRCRLTIFAKANWTRFSNELQSLAWKIFTFTKTYNDLTFRMNQLLNIMKENYLLMRRLNDSSSAI